MSSNNRTARVRNGSENLDFAERVCSSYPLDRLFWLSAVIERLATRPTEHREAAFAAAARRIYATFRVSPAAHQEAVRLLANRLIPLD